MMLRTKPARTTQVSCGRSDQVGDELRNVTSRSECARPSLQVLSCDPLHDSTSRTSVYLVNVNQSRQFLPMSWMRATSAYADVSGIGH